MNAAPRRPTLQRIAGTQVFFANGVGIGAWAASLPDLKLKLGLGDGALSLALLALAAGAVITMPLAGFVAPRFGTGPATRWAAPAFGLALLLPAFAASLPVLVVFAAVLGAANGCLDVCMNAQATDTERRWGAPIMSSYHAAFSTGGLVGSAGGAALLAFRPGTSIVLYVAAIVVVVLAVGAGPFLGRGDKSSANPGFARPRAGTYALCAAAFACLLCEGAMADWSAVYLTMQAGASPSVAGLGYAAFSGAMLIGRLTGDRAVDRLGRVAVVQGGGSLAAVGLVLAAVMPGAWTATLGFALVGLGLANIVPVLFSVAGRVASASGIAMVATAGYGGFLAGPPLVGTTATVVGLRWAFAGLALAACGLPLLAAAVRDRASTYSARHGEAAEGSLRSPM